LEETDLPSGVPEQHRFVAAKLVPSDAIDESCHRLRRVRVIEKQCFGARGELERL
jgi:hypothetical protein